ncbi:MAG: MATE family efflux transporter [Bacteroidales bacterium]|nr:MATE family efflux transporter [Bacteroidales bacterium]
MKYFLVATILTTIVQQLNVVVDGIVVSQFVGPDALSAVNLYQPLSLLVTSVCTLFGMGATVYASKLMGQRDTDKVNHILSTALVSLVVAGVVLALVSVFLEDWIVDVICQEERLESYFRSYSFTMLSFCCVNMLSMFVDQMVNIDGSPQKVSRSVLISAVVNLILDIVFVGVLDMGVAGSAYATIVSLVVNILILSGTLFSKQCSIRLNPFGQFSAKMLGQNLKYGLPLIISNLVLMLLFILLNNTIQDKQGADGMFAMSICMNILSISMMITGGIGSTLLAIGGFLNGQQDYRGIRFLVNGGLKMQILVLAVIMIVAEFVPSALTSLFGANTTELALYADNCVRIFAWMLLVVMPALLLANVYQVVGRLALSPLIVLTFPLSLIPSLLMCSYLWGDAAVWYGFPMAGIIVALLVVVITEVVRRKNADLSFLTLVPAEKHVEAYDSSIPHDMELFASSLADLLEYLLSKGIPQKLADDIMHCLEEVILNIIEHGGPTNKKKYTDVYINKMGDWVIASIKDDGRPFDPVKYSEDKMRNGLKILHSYCSHLEYKFMYGQNMTFMKWNIPGQEERNNKK